MILVNRGDQPAVYSQAAVYQGGLGGYAVEVNGHRVLGGDESDYLDGALLFVRGNHPAPDNRKVQGLVENRPIPDRQLLDKRGEIGLGKQNADSLPPCVLENEANDAGIFVRIEFRPDDSVIRSVSFLGHSFPN